MASLFGITPADLLNKILPFSSEDGGTFSIGADGPPTNDLSNAVALSIIEEQEAIVESYLRHNYQELLRRVPGEIAVNFARAGQTECRLGLVPVTELLGVYINFPRSRAWKDRRPSEALASDKYSINLTTGVLTLVQPLAESDRVFVDYTHTGASKLLDLRHLVLSLAAVEVSRRFAYFGQSSVGAQRFEGWQASAAGHLRDLGRTDGAQIGLFDRLELVNETKNLNLGGL